MVDHAVAVENVAAEHPLELGRRVRPVGSGGNQDRDVFRSDLRQLIEQRQQHFSTRLGAGDVADGNGHALALAHELAKWRALNRRADGLSQRDLRFGNCRPEDRFDDGHPLIGEFNLETVAAVVKEQSHELGELRSRCALQEKTRRRLPAGRSGSPPRLTWSESPAAC